MHGIRRGFSKPRRMPCIRVVRWPRPPYADCAGGPSPQSDGKALASITLSQRGAMSRNGRGRHSSRERGTAAHSVLEIVVAVAASLIMALMVAGGGAAAERMTATDPTDHEPAPLSWREST